MASRLLTIVFTDIKGFTERTSKADREFVLRLREKHDSLLKPIVRQYGGYLVKTIGDAFLLTFESPTNALLCALMMQDRLREYNLTAAPLEKIEIRVAINTGEVSVTDGDILGEPVNVASRVEHITEANEVWFTEATYLAMNKQEVPNSLVGEFRLKGVPEALKVYRVVQDMNSEQFKQVVATQQQKIADINAQSNSIPSIRIIMLIVAICIGASIGVIQTWRSATNPFLLEARNAMETGQALPALLASGKLLEEAPNDPEGLEIMRKSLDSAVRQAVSGKDLPKARQLLDKNRQKFSFLGPLPDLEAHVITHEARQMAFSGDRAGAEQLVTRLADEQKGHVGTLEEIALFYGETGYWWNKTIRFYHELALTDPIRWAGDPKFLKEMDFFLHQVEPDEGFDEVRSFIASYCFDHFQKILVEAIATKDLDNRALRWNAMAIFKLKGIPMDPQPIYLAEILDSPGSVDSGLLKEAAGFFLASGATASIPNPIDRFPLFSTQLLATDSLSMRLAGGPFLKPLEGLLCRSLSDVASFDQRVNSFVLLKEKNALLPEQSWCYHATNVIDWESVIGVDNAFRWNLIESLQFLASNAVPAEGQLKPAFRPDLEAVKNALAKIHAASAKYGPEAASHGHEELQKLWEGIGEGARGAEQMLYKR